MNDPLKLLTALMGLSALAPAHAQTHDHDLVQSDTMDHHMGHDMATMADEGHIMPAAFGPYAMTREASGTSWQPDATPNMGIMSMRGDWQLMGHGMLNLVYDNQSGPRGDDKAFLSGMMMGMATGTLSDRDTVQLRAMVSPDPFMGKRGYPLLLAAGETADGVNTLVDRQHPHELFMELAASYSRRIGTKGSVFLYAGIPGEPAFGPPAFMHRASIMDSPEAPITHHWLDSTHIAFGVVTAGVTWGDVKVEASRFKGREPDEKRYNIETPKLDSTAVRLSWNPSANWALQASWARQKSPEQLSPDDDQEKLSASAMWTRKLGNGGLLAATFAWGQKTRIEPGGVRDHALNAFALEASLKPDARWTVFARGERIDTDELLPVVGAAHGPEYTAGKASVGAIYDVPVATKVAIGVGGLVARSFTPDALDHSYGGDRTSGMIFARLKIG